MLTFLDLTRISTRLLRGAPTGIDRVEFAYAQELVQKENYGEVVSVITTPLFTGAVRHGTMRTLLDRIERSWLLDSETGLEDPFYGELRAAIEAPAATDRPHALRLKRQSRRQAMGRALQLPVQEMVRSRARLAAATNRSAGGARSYFHCSHTQTDKPQRFAWLERRGVPAVFFIHDAIPVLYPEFCSPGSAARHHARLQTASERGALLIVNSEATKRSVAGYMESQGWRVPEIEVVPLGVDRWFSDRDAPRPRAPNAPYFVCIGTIEPRKNLIFLFNVWRELARRHGPNTPKLVLVGRRGWENENMIDVLERSTSLAPHLIEVADLPDLGLAALLKGARALLAPSQVEGFSLPVAEALSLGTPVVASDIAVHREVADGHARLLGTIDGNGWVEAIEGLTDVDGPSRAEALKRAQGYSAISWGRHVELSMEIVSRVAEHARGRPV
ncbi:glycosyltransferase family 4 protein [Lutibaculum baratangense]|uniref:Glycosyl transferase, group 1 n=1 Tax=Lutibaculum baratangense AMV1 TaxID=631454 RepID=V4R8W5_9HYPH|nr:glycosyltransferase family 1 protein [Lutibaculum baratangense]ESR22631.1 hypothetical protein N177_3767 [Lutibaculum baratangense AMV1]